MDRRVEEKLKQETKSGVNIRHILKDLQRNIICWGGIIQKIDMMVKRIKTRPML